MEHPRLIDRAATALYVEARVALIDYPDIRLRTTTCPVRMSVFVHLHGSHRPHRWATWALTGAVEVWVEDIIRDAPLAGASVRERVEREFHDLLRRGTRQDDVRVAAT